MPMMPRNAPKMTAKETKLIEAIKRIPDPHYFAEEFGGFNGLYEALLAWEGCERRTDGHFMGFAAAVIVRLRFLIGHTAQHPDVWKYRHPLGTILQVARANRLGRVVIKFSHAESMLYDTLSLMRNPDPTMIFRPFARNGDLRRVSNGMLAPRIVFMGLHPRTGAQSTLLPWSRHVLFERQLLGTVLRMIKF